MFIVARYQFSDNGSIISILAPISPAMVFAFLLSYSFWTKIVFIYFSAARSIINFNLDGEGSFPSNSTAISSSP